MSIIVIFCALTAKNYVIFVWNDKQMTNNKDERNKQTNKMIESY